MKQKWYEIKTIHFFSFNKIIVRYQYFLSLNTKSTGTHMEI
jgi:hypothetical protein